MLTNFIQHELTNKPHQDQKALYEKAVRLKLTGGNYQTFAVQCSRLRKRFGMPSARKIEGGRSAVPKIRGRTQVADSKNGALTLQELTAASGSGRQCRQRHRGSENRPTTTNSSYSRMTV